jgi:inhibitor of KinA sporulation pathway (predicted exonuclease)
MNPTSQLKYCSLDLELNNKKDGTVPKIIQVGIALGETSENIKTYSWYVDPEEKITDFISNLTGITDEMIAEKSVPLSQVAEELGNLLTEEKPLCNPITWGGGDAAELLQEFRDGEIDVPFFGYRIFDVKTLGVFNSMVKGNSTSGGLRKYMNRYGVSFIGTPHNAMDDALNTLRFFFYFLERQRIFENYKEVIKEMK